MAEKLSTLFINNTDHNPNNAAFTALRDAIGTQLDNVTIAQSPSHDMIAKKNVLQSINEKLQADGFVFLGKPDALTMYQLYFLVDRAQTSLPQAMLSEADGSPALADGKATQKPIILINEHGEYDSFIARISDLVAQGSAKTNIFDTGVVNVVKTPAEAVALLKEHKFRQAPLFVPQHQEFGETEGVQAASAKPRLFVCCGFSVKNELLKQTGKRTSQLLARDYNIVTGGGRGGMMHEFQLAAYKGGAHVTGVTFPALNTLAHSAGKGSETFGISHIVNANTMPERIETMTNIADGILILPGGFGTDTECIAPLMMNQLSDGSKKPIIIQNIVNPTTGYRCHDGLVTLLQETGFKEGKDFVVVEPPLIDLEGNEIPLARYAKLDMQNVHFDQKASVEKAARMTALAIQADIRPQRGVPALG